MESNIYSLILFVCGIITAIVPLFLFRKKKALNRYLAYILLLAALWAISYAAELMQDSLSRTLSIVSIEYIGIAFLPAFWLLFVLKFVELHRLIRARFILPLFLFPTLTILLVWTNRWHHLHYTSVVMEKQQEFSLFKFEAGPWYILFTIYYYLVLFLSVLLLVKSGNRSDQLFRKQRRLLLFGACIPWVFNVLYLAGVRPQNGLDMTPFAFLLSSGCFAYALIRYQLLNILPVAREQIIDALKQGVLAVDNEYRIIDLNPEMRKIFAKHEGDLTASPLKTVCPDLAEAVVGKKELELAIPSEGAEKVYQITISVLRDKQGIEKGKILLFTDVTEKKEAERTLLAAKLAAEQATIAKDQFLSTMSHEIRTPMNGILGFTHLLLQNEPRQDQVEFLNIQKFSAENLLVLINDILDYSKIEAGKIQFEDTPLDLRQLLQSCIATLERNAAEKGVELELAVGQDSIESVMGDPVRINQILTNLISNAIKFTERGKVTLSIKTIHSSEEATRFLFEVRDTGIGIPADKIDSIFESFTQASSDTTRKFGGTGLGLTITKRLLALMNSEIKVKSQLGEGSTFFFELELKHAPASSAAKQARAASDYSGLEGKKVLIVDDNSMNVLLARQFLTKWGISYGVAKDGLEALEAVKATDYDLVLMDLQMPVMDGYTSTVEIRKLEDKKYRELPIVALSASAMSDVQSKVFAAGMTDFLTKPFTPDSLHDKVSTYLRR